MVSADVNIWRQRYSTCNRSFSCHSPERVKRLFVRCAFHWQQRERNAITALVVAICLMSGKLVGNNVTTTF